jgi:hypothetical protein
LTIRAAEVVPDPIDTIISVSLDRPLPPLPTGRPVRPSPVPPGNLATGKPARLLSTDGCRDLVPSAFQFARFGVDGLPSTHAQGAFEWAWMYHVDLEAVHPIRRVAIRFAPGCFATEYRILLSEDGRAWREAARVAGAEGGLRDHVFDPISARFVRVQAIKPDGEGQSGVQMGIAELEAYR